MTPGYHPPPLRAVIVAIAISIAILALTVFFDYKEQTLRNKLFFEHHSKRLEDFKSDNLGGGLKVVGVGTSLFRASTYYDKDMNAYAWQRLNIPLEYLRISEPGGGNLDWQPLMQKIIQADPDVILIENYYLFYRRNLNRSYYSRSQRYFKDKRIHKRWQVTLAEMSEKIDLYEQIKAKKKEVTKEKLIKKRKSKDKTFIFGLRPGYKEIFEICQKKNISIIVLDMPIHSKARIAFGEERLQYINNKLTELETEGLIKRLAGPYNLNNNDFADLRHMTQSGREKYSSWLIKNLHEMVH